MNKHELILSLFLVAGVFLALIFYYVYSTTLYLNNDGNTVQKPKQKRFYFFIVLTAVLLILLSITVPKSPYFLFSKDNPAKVVYVDALQFTYLMGYAAINPKDPKTEPNIEVPLNKVVEFRITSSDVNHGFAIYNQYAELITQTQAMPGYVNKLRWKFDKPGVYNILCLEFCGAGHPSMRGTFTVK